MDHFDALDANQDRSEMFIAIINLESKLLLLETSYFNKSIESVKFTPMRGNQLSYAIMLKQTEDLDRKAFLNKFSNKFWTSCSCRKRCFSKVPWSEVLRIYEDVSKRNFNERSLMIGGLLQNFKKDRKTTNITIQRERYKYRIANNDVCKNFF